VARRASNSSATHHHVSRNTRNFANPGPALNRTTLPACCFVNSPAAASHRSRRRKSGNNSTGLPSITGKACNLCAGGVSHSCDSGVPAQIQQ
jgi:hypothetical protein